MKYLGVAEEYDVEEVRVCRMLKEKPGDGDDEQEQEYDDDDNDDDLNCDTDYE